MCRSEEFEHITKSMKANTTNFEANTYIGATDLHLLGDPWYWLANGNTVNQTALKWLPGEPSIPYIGESCATIAIRGNQIGARDVECGVSAFKFICQENTVALGFEDALGRWSPPVFDNTHRVRG